MESSTEGTPRKSVGAGEGGHPRVLVVDDDRGLRELLRIGLEGEGFAVATTPNGPAALEAVEADPPDAVVLDVMMPGMDGFEVCRRLRATNAVPILMLTAKGEESDVVAGLDAGADEYVSKPFSVRVLAARLRSLLRRRELELRAIAHPSSGRVTFRGGRFALDGGKQSVEVEGRTVPLSRMEFALMQHLVANAGQVVSHTELMQQLWSGSGPAEYSRLRTYMGLLRRKLGERGRRGRYLHSHHGAGYRFEVE